MGILRTDKISGLETPTAVTGSVSFDGTGDSISVGPLLPTSTGTAFTVDMFWRSTSNTSQTCLWEQHNSGSGRTAYFINGTNAFLISEGNTVGSFAYSDNVWYFTRVTYTAGGEIEVFVNGVSRGTGTQTVGVDNVNFVIGDRSGENESFNGYISNCRVVVGSALNGTEVPTHALEVIGDTVLLCCNNPDSAGAEATGKTITVNGDAAASTVSPSLTRDFTSGTEFSGVTVFDTQGYFVPPSGTTEQRGAGRAVFAGGYIGPTRNAFIESVNINTLGNTTKFGTLKFNSVPTSTSSATRQLVAGGYDGAIVDNIDFVTIASSSNSIDFGTLGTGRRDSAALSNNTRSIWGGGTTTGSTNPTVNMEYVTSASLGDGTSFGSLTASGRANAACASPTRGMFFGGYQAYASPVSTYTNVINYITIATTGGGTDFGDLAVDNNGQKGGHAAFSSSTRGVVGGGAIYGPDAPAYTVYSTIEYVTIATTGNAQDFGDLTASNNYLSGVTNSVRGIFNQGSNPATYLNTIQYVTIASTGNAQDFGDAINTSFTYNNSGSDSHGGIS